jgi:hypothetical protein
VDDLRLAGRLDPEHGAEIELATGSCRAVELPVRGLDERGERAERRPCEVVENFEDRLPVRVPREDHEEEPGDPRP